MKKQRGAGVVGILVAIVGVGIGFFVLALIFGVIVPPGMMGVRQINFGPGKGFSKRGLVPGYHWRIPFYSEIQFVPQTLRIVDFEAAQDHEEDAKSNAIFPALEIQTSDRATINVDLTTLARFYRDPGEDHGGPLDLFTNVGISEERWQNKIRRTVDDALKRTLGTLSTGEFYNPKLREERVAMALQIINDGVPEQQIRGLKGDGIAIEAVLLRRYTYREARIENAIFQKNLQDQEEALSVAEGRLSEAQAASADEEAKGDARNRTLEIEGDNKVRIIRSEGDLYESQKKAEADLLVASAQAEVDRLKATALARSAGAEVFVARELAPLLSSLRGGVITDIDPYNLEEWTKRLGVSGQGGLQ